MKETAYSRVREVFHEVFPLTPEERPARLDALCAGDSDLRKQVESILAANERAQAAGGLHVDAIGSPPAEIGGCRILGILGEGGMGVVYEAEQREPSRRVALKIIRPGFVTDSMLRRFRLEAEVLGRLKHPGIAQIYGVGVDDSNGRKTPYLLMELVEGESLRQYARTRHLDTRERLELIIRICEAVEHAHRRGVIHRDLKPGNILVNDAGEPRILDFGIARITESDVHTTRHTEVGQLLGTAAYMSPEQASGDPDNLDTRSDVYTLGVILYELLTDQLPIDVEHVSMLEAVRRISEQNPTRLRSIQPSLRGDIETIIDKALEKSAERRYASAHELAADIQRHLNDHPILAHPPSAIYQLTKFARRNRTAVAAASLILISLVAALVLVSAANVKARRALVRSDATTNFLEQLLIGIGPRYAASRDTELLRALLDDADKEVNFIKDPVVRGEMLLLIGEVYTSIFAFDRSIDTLTRAVALLSDRPWYDDDLLTARFLLATSHYKSGDLAAALPIYEDVIERMESDEAHDDRIGQFLIELANLSVETGDWDQALALAERAVERSPRSSDPIAHAHAQAALGIALRRHADLDEAERAFLVAYELFSQDETRRIECSNMLNSLAMIARQTNDAEIAVKRYREAYELRMSIDDRANPDTATLLSNLGRAEAEVGQTAAAIETLRQSIAMHHEVYPDGHYGIAIVTQMLASVYTRTGQHELAVETAREAVEIATAHLPEKHPIIVFTLAQHARSLDGSGKVEQALAIWRRCIRMGQDLDLERTRYLGPLQRDFAVTLGHGGHIGEALEYLREALVWYQDEPDNPTAGSIRDLIEKFEASPSETTPASTSGDGGVEP